MLDYMKAYRTTGRPPQPSPLNPTDRGARARAGLPPLFKPYVENGTVAAPEEHCAAAAITTLVPYASSAPPPNDISAIPDVHAYLSTPETTDVGNTVFLQHISCQYTYSAFSAEVRTLLAISSPLHSHLDDQELRCKAYSKGKVFVPEVEGSDPHLLTHLFCSNPGVRYLGAFRRRRAPLHSRAACLLETQS